MTVTHATPTPSPRGKLSATAEKAQLGKPTVLARLHSLFPTSPNSSAPNVALNRDKTLPPLPPGVNQASKGPAERPFLKVRILTWNMHDSVPKGDLDELFGKVPLYSPPNPSTLEPGSIPQFSKDENHPYHIVVVAGQECPTISGMPMGLGAGFKLIDKEDLERHKSSKHKEHTPKDAESIRSRKKDPEWEKEKDRDEREPPQEGSPISGWTAMVEDKLCYAGTLSTANRPMSPTGSEISIPKPLQSRCTSKDPKRGPYQLLMKERLMGIYLAVYIHRDLKPFVRGASRDAVTAGLIGGRVGNKGGVGITANIAGTTFLFLNCHLAAHEGRLHNRLNNLAKIKAELDVDDFLEADDPRMVAEDLTDKFDFTFLFGDLNFRLDIKRLHADWLISRKDYAQALTFDQLKAVIANGEAFVGFEEGPINFPPTFKYDVLRTLKMKRGDSKLHLLKNQERAQRITEVHEAAVTDAEEEDGDKDTDGEADVTSLASSMWTSTHSKAAANEGADEFFSSGPATLQHSASVPGSKKLSLAAAKAKAKWVEIISPSASGSPIQWLKVKSNGIVSPLRKRSTDSSLEVDAVEPNGKIDVPARSASLDDPTRAEQLLVPPGMGAASSSIKSSVPSDDEGNGQSNKGVYDSSSKKRVPSWCDRILFKSTVEPDNDEENGDETEEEPPTRRRSLAQIFANALRPLSGRSRGDSVGSITVGSLTSPIASPTATPPVSPPLPSRSAQNVMPISRFLSHSAPSPAADIDALTKSLSNDVLGKKPSLARSTSHNADTRLRRSRSTSSSSKPANTGRRIRRSMTLSDPHSGHAPGNEQHSPQSGLGGQFVRWRFFPSFLTPHNHPTSVTVPPDHTLPTLLDPPPPPPRKGEVVCISYDTLDDVGMRRLEGRSDHRPVIGSYAVYT